MNQRNQEVQALFEAAIALATVAQRTEYLRRTCPDAELRREVESLLEAHQNPDRIFATDTVRMEPRASTRVAVGVGVGARIGGYRIVRPLGQGGMGAVYEAEEIENGRRVALKVLNQGLDSPLARQRFRREGLLAASINHPNTVFVFGTEEIEGLPVIAMELVSGGTLQERVQQNGPLDVADAVDAILQVMAGLEAAAALGVLHRDIKPSNCFLELDGTVKVGDFGLSISSAAVGDAKLTATGSFLGTPAYSPPEQVRGDDFTIQGDIYAVGVTLYYLLTGQTPFQGDDLVRMLATVLERPAESPAKLRPELPSGLCRSILRCLEKQPAKRFRDYAELRNALLPFSSMAPTPATLSLRFLAGCLDGTLLIATSVSLTLLSTGHWDALLHPELYPGAKLRIATLSILPALLYYAVLEGRWGASLGKRICGLWVAGPNRGLPGIPRALLRSLIVQGLPALPAWLFSWFSFRPWGTAAPDPALLILALLFCTERKRNGFAAVQDLLSRTRVLRKSTHEARPRLEGIADPPAPAEAAPQFGPYSILETLEKGDAEEVCLGFDAQLKRKVWIRQLPVGAPPVAPHLRSLTRVGRLRWLNGRRSSMECWDAYEAGPGKPLLDLIRRRQPWNQVRFWLLDIANEMAAADKDQSLPATLDLDRIWITADGRAKLLDFPAPLRGLRRVPPQPEPVSIRSDLDSRPQRLLCQMAVAALAGRDVTAIEARTTSVAIPLPLHARELLDELQAGLSPTQLADRLNALQSKLATVSTGRRLGVIAGGFAFPLTVAALWVAFVGGLILLSKTQPEAVALAQCLNQLAVTQPTRDSSGGDAGENPNRDAFEIYIVGRFRPMITNRATWTRLAGATFLRDQRAAAEQLITRRPSPTELELKQAAEVVEPYLKHHWPTELVNPRGKLKPGVLIYFIAGALVFGSALPGLLAALLFRGGLALRVLGLTIVRHDGTTASRFRILSRSLIAWAPLLLLALLATWPLSALQDVSWKRAALMSIGLLPAAALILWAALLPERGLQDRLAGTCLVPRE